MTTKPTKPVFVCGDCESEDCELQFAMVDGHRVPGLWHCNQCGWEGKMRKCIFVEIKMVPFPSVYAKKTDAEVRASRSARAGTTTRATGKERVVIPSLTEAWKEALEKAAEEVGIPEELLQPASVPSMQPEDAAQEVLADISESLELPAPETPDPKSTCPINCPHCGEPLVKVLMQCNGSINWAWWTYIVSGDSEWRWIMEETWTYSCPTCGEQLNRDDLDEIPDIY